MDYLLLTASILLATGCNLTYHKLGGGERYNPYLFSAVSSFVWLAVLAPSGIKNLQSSEVLWGIAYGTVQALFLFFKMRAMSTGPVSITTVVGNCSMLLSTLFGILCFRESVSIFQIFGVVGILASVLLCLDTKADMKTTAKWKLFCTGFFLFAAGVGIIFKLFSATDGFAGNMLIISAVTMVILMTLLSFFATKGHMRLEKKHTLYALAAGLMSLGYNRLNLYLSGALPSVVFFPIFNGAIVLLAASFGVFLFKERLSKKQIFGILLGLFAIILLSGVFKI